MPSASQEMSEPEGNGKAPRGTPDFPTIDDIECRGARILLRVDINSPLDPKSKAIADDTRIDQSIPSIRDLAERGAMVTVIAHQGDTLDYHNLASLCRHAEMLEDKLGRPVEFIDDIAGPAARARIANLQQGEILLLENLRYYVEEVSTFEAAVKLTAHEMTRTHHVRNLAPLFDYYVNDAFAAAHRNAPSMVAFQELLPTAAGRRLVIELDALAAVTTKVARPSVFVLGGLKISDAFAMLGRVLSDGTADVVLTGGITGQVFLMAAGHHLGEPSEQFIRARSLDAFIPEATTYLDHFGEKIHMPVDVATATDDVRHLVPVASLPAPAPIVDIGRGTVEEYTSILAGAATIFVNGPPGVYESDAGADGTAGLWTAVADAAGTSVIGGGDTVASARRFIDLSRIDFVSTGGGALIRYLSGHSLPLLEAMKSAAIRWRVTHPRPGTSSV